jgi:hypothetical protein
MQSTTRNDRIIYLSFFYFNLAQNISVLVSLWDRLFKDNEENWRIAKITELLEE